MTITVLCAVAAIPAVLIVGCLRCRRSLNQPTNQQGAMVLVRNHEMSPDNGCGWVGEEVDDHRPGEVS